MLNPDDYLILTALEADKGGYKNDAMWRLRDAAGYGNKHAQYFIGLLHLQKNDSVTGLAWLKLAGPGIGNNDHLMAALHHQLNPDQLLQADHLLAELKLSYNPEKAIKQRAAWKKRQKFGSLIPGYISPFWSTTLANGRQVGAQELRQRIDAFIYDYRFDRAEVILKDLETVDPEAETEQPEYSISRVAINRVATQPPRSCGGDPLALDAGHESG